MNPRPEHAAERRRRRGGALVAIAAALAALAALAGPAAAQQPAFAAPPFTATLSNTVPLAFGMDATTAAHALGRPLLHVGGAPGNETFLVFRDHGGSGWFDRHDRLYLQFRNHRLTGWKGDWGHNWMWR